MAGFIPAPAAPQIVRQGQKLIIPVPPQLGQMVVLPPLCVKCGAPVNGKPLVKTFYWHSPALYLFIFLGVLVYLIAAVIVRKGIKLSVPLCAEHAKRRGIAITLAWVLPLVGIADGFILPRFNIDGGLVAMIVGACLLAGLVIWGVVGNPLRPTMIDSTRGEFTGFCSGFLEQFPDANSGFMIPQAGLPPAIG